MEIEIEKITSPVEADFRFGSHKSADARLREIDVNGSRVFLFECRSCGREFGREDEESYWRAVRVGPFRVSWLPDEVTAQWVAEPCLGKSVEVVPTISPPPQTAKANLKHRGRPPKVRYLPAVE